MVDTFTFAIAIIIPSQNVEPESDRLVAGSIAQPK